MTGLEELSKQLQALSVELYLEGENLRVNAPKNTLTPELLTDIKQYKNELMMSLNANTATINTALDNMVIPLSIGQQRLWSLMELQAESSVYNVPMVHRVTGELDVQKLTHSLSLLQARQWVLRTAFRMVDEQPISEVVDSTDVAFSQVNLEQVPDHRKERRLERVLNAEIKHQFDMQQPPLWRCTLIKMEAQEWVLAFTFHHIIYDLYSKSIFLNELAALYNGEPLPPLSIQYQDYACWQQGPFFQRSLAQQMAYWEAHFETGATELLLPTDHARQPSLNNRGDSVPFAFEAALTEDLNGLCREHNVSMYMLLLTAFNVLLNRYTHQTEQIVCSPVACRNKTSIEGLIGYFNNIIPMRTDLSGNPSLIDLLARVRQGVLAANRAQDAPFLQICNLKTVSRTPMTRGMFNFRMESSSELNLRGVTTQAIENRRSESDFDLALYSGISQGCLQGVLDFNSLIFERDTVSALLQHYKTILQAFVSDSTIKLQELPGYGTVFDHIELTLTQHPKVDEAKVVVRSDAGNKSHMVAYLVLNEENPASQTELNAYVETHLAVEEQNIILFPIDYMPYHADGTTDISALPAPVISRHLISHDYVAPRNQLEARIAEIWQRILWLEEPVGVNDDFFDLGGHSLLSVQMLMEVEACVKRPIAGIRQLSTIAKLVAHLDQGGAEAFVPDHIDVALYRKISPFVAAWRGVRKTPDSLVVGMNTHGKKQPVFWCVQAYMNLEKIAQGLGPSQPIYGMRSGHAIMEYNDENIANLAHYYVEEVLQIQPQGPYIIGGICQATEIAFQMAVKLTQLGHEVNLLGLQERFIPASYQGPVAFLFGKKSTRNPYFHFSQPELGWQKHYRGDVKVYTMTGKHGRYFGDGNIDSLTQQMRDAIAGIGSKEGVISRSEHDLQLLPPEAYQATLELIVLEPQDSGWQATIKVTNISPVTWKSSSFSGVFLGARWLDPAKVNQECYTPYLANSGDRVALPQDVRSGESMELMLAIKQPVHQHAKVVEIDLVDEGINWFADRGSGSIQITPTTDLEQI